MIPNARELLEAGVHFGHKVSRSHPKMKPYIYGAKDGVQIIDLNICEKMLRVALEYVENLGKNGGTIIFVGTKKQARPIVEELAKEAGAYYLTHRWIGGFLTNFEEIQKNIKRLKSLKEQKEKGELGKYTKKEQLLIDRQILKLTLDFAGVLDLEKIPDALFIVDTVAERTAVNEAVKLGKTDQGKVVNVVAIADSNSDPTLIDYPIPGNDDAIKSIRILTQAVAEAYKNGKALAGKAALRQEKKAAKKVAKETGAEALLEDVEIAAAEEEVEKEALKESERKVE
ncbi:MAG: 30S ribosomal protein S2 [Candidatus Daviesbacteria bacterium]|nr:MAG: 30S ribosomal protein S2 [Candidatus Daviesbacteria bacterium]